MQMVYQHTDFVMAENGVWDYLTVKQVINLNFFLIEFFLSFV